VGGFPFAVGRRPVDARVRLVLIFALLAASATTAAAQTAQLTGRITDSSLAVLPGATVIVTNMETGSGRRVTSNDEGYYAAPFLPPGIYRIAVRCAGFRPITREGITLSVEQVLRLDIVLELEGFEEQVSIEARAPLLERDNPSVGQVVDRKTMETLPLNGRIYSQPALLTAGAVPNPNSRATDGFNLNGNRTFQNNFLLDGMDNNIHIGGAGTGSTQTLRPALEAIQEFKVDSANYSAEYGRAAGGIISVATKSGTNAFHGSAFEFLRHDALEANDILREAGRPEPAAARVSPIRRDRRGASASSPEFLFCELSGHARASNLHGDGHRPDAGHGAGPVRDRADL